MKCKLSLFIFLILIASLGLIACDKNSNDRSVNDVDYNSVLSQGLKEEGIPLQNVLSKRLLMEIKLLYTLCIMQ